MALSNDLIQEFASVMGNAKEKHVDTTCYGKVTRMESSTNGFIQLDGADSETPASFTVAAHVNDRVLAILKNRSALVIGNITHPVIMTGTLYASDAIVIEGYLTTNASRTRYNDTSNGLTFDSNGIGAYSNLSSWWLKNDGTFQFGGENGITFSNNKVRFGSDVVLTWGSISDKPDNIATTDDIPSGILTTSNYTGTITKTYIDGLNVIAQNISGVTLSGKTISGGEIKIGTPSNNVYPFQVTSAGAMTSTSGKIAGFTINGDKLYTNNHSAYNTNAQGVFIDPNYIALGANGATYIAKDGSFQFGGANGIKYANSKVTLGSDVSISWTSVTDTSNVAVKSDIPSGILTTSNYTGTITKTYIDGLNVIAQNISGTTLSGKTISGGEIKIGTPSNNVYPFQVTSGGSLTATSGTIGGWSLGTNKLYSGSNTASTNTAGYVTLSTADFTRTINGTSRGSLRFAIGSNLGVSSSGVLYAGSAVIGGTLSAGAGSTIGPWTVSATSIYKGNAAHANAAGMYFGDDGLSVTNKFYVTKYGVPHCNGAVLYINNTSSTAGASSSGITFQLNGTDKGELSVYQSTTSGAYLQITSYGGFVLEALGPVSFSSSYQGATTAISLNSTGVDVSGDVYVGNVYGSTFYGNVSGHASDDLSKASGGTVSADVTIRNHVFATNTIVTTATDASNVYHQVVNNTYTMRIGVHTNAGLYVAKAGTITTGFWAVMINSDGLVKVPNAAKELCTVVNSYDDSRYTVSKIASYSATEARLWGKGGNSSNSLTRYSWTVSSSDIRLKENIKDTEVKNALSIINRLKLHSFDWKSDKRHWAIGIIADEVEKVEPMLVLGKGGYDKDGYMDTKSIDTFYMQGYIIKAIQELSAENEKLKEEIEKLKGAA